jgi:maltose O-acetyltransferase
MDFPCRFDAPEYLAQRRRVQAVLRRLNASTPDDLAERRAAMEALFGTVGRDVWIEPPFHCDVGTNIHLGDSVFLNTGVVVLDIAEVRFGSYVLVGPGAHFYAATHSMDPAVRRRTLAGPLKPIHVGDDVWIGGRSVIMPGVSIGAGAVIGAGSVVTRDVPELAVATGNPARVVRLLEPGEER